MAAQRDQGHTRFTPHVLAFGLGLLALVLAILHSAPAAADAQMGILQAVPTSATDLRIHGEVAENGLATWGPCAPNDVWENAWNATVSAVDGRESHAVTSLGRIVACYPAEDYAVLELLHSNQTLGMMTGVPTPLGPDGKPWLLRLDDGPRMAVAGGHMNNPTLDFRIQSTADLSAPINQPPVPWVPYLVQCPTAGPCTIPLPVADADPLDPLSIAWAAGEETRPFAAGFPWDNPGPCATKAGSPGCGTVVAATLDQSDPDHARLVWDTQGATLHSDVCKTRYSAGILAHDARVLSQAQFHIRLCDDPAPQWTAPSPCGTTRTVAKGDSVSFAVQATDADTNRVLTLWSRAQPAGATVNLGSPANTVSATFDWSTTAVAEGRYTSIYWAVDDRGVGAPCQIVIRVMPAGWTPVACLGPEMVETGMVATFTASGDDGAYTWYSPWSSPHEGSEATLTTMFFTPGSRSVEVTSGNSRGDCVVMVWGETLLPLFAPPLPGLDEDPKSLHRRNALPVPAMRPIRECGLKVTFDATPSYDVDGLVMEWRWDFGDGFGGPGSFVEHEYPRLGFFIARLTAVDDVGASRTGLALVIVRACDPRPEDCTPLMSFLDPEGCPPPDKDPTKEREDPVDPIPPVDPDPVPPVPPSEPPGGDGPGGPAECDPLPCGDAGGHDPGEASRETVGEEASGPSAYWFLGLLVLPAAAAGVVWQRRRRLATLAVLRGE